jgi:outer membrane protein assembly factor BamD
MKKLVSLFLLLMLFLSCSEFQNALKSEDNVVKLTLATKLYDEGKYAKAIRLFEQISPSYKGKPQGERMFYMLAQSYYKTNQYYLAGFNFDTFSAGYPRSDKSEEAAFLGAKCYSKLSPKYSLDQIDTQKGIDKFQIFINNYPDSKFLPEANEIVKMLREKIEFKVYENARIYNKIARYSADHVAAMRALENFIIDYPGTPYQEDALFFKFDSAYKLAVNSVERKKLERLKSAQSAYNALIKFRPDTKHLSKVSVMIKEINKQLESSSI